MYHLFISLEHLTNTSQILGLHLGKSEQRGSCTRSACKTIATCGLKHVLHTSSESSSTERVQEDRVTESLAWYVVFEREFQSNHFPRVVTRMSLSNTQITSISYLQHKKITRTSTLKCPLKCYEKLNSRFALEHRYFTSASILSVGGCELASL